MQFSGRNGDGILQEFPPPGNSSGGPLRSRTSGVVIWGAWGAAAGIPLPAAGREKRAMTRNARAQAEGTFFIGGLLP